MAKICPICGGKIGLKVKVADGIICAPCSNISTNHRIESVNTLTEYSNENRNRASRFQKTAVLKSFLSESVIIDQTNRLFYVGKEGKTTYPIYYSFDEVSDYHSEKVGGKTITKSKGGIGRAVVGGALFGGVGAIVGASTSKKETKTVGGVNVVQIILHTFSGKKTISIANPPDGLLPFLDSCMGE